MKIEYYGHSCFKIITDSGKSVLTDPYTQIGYELPAGLSADIVTVSHDHFDHGYVAAVQTERVIRKSGRYDFGDIRIVGFDTKHDECGGAKRGDNVVFVVQASGINVCHFGDLGEADVQKLCAVLPKIDVLLLPVGGTYTIDAATAAKYVEALAPFVTVPMHFKTPDCNIGISGVEGFVKCVGAKAEYADGSFEIEPTNERKIIIPTRIK